MNRALFLLPCMFLVEGGPIPLSIEGLLTRLLEQSPLAALFVWLWLRDGNRRERREKAAEARYEHLVQTLIDTMKERVECPMVALERDLSAQDQALGLIRKG